MKSSSPFKGEVGRGMGWCLSAYQGRLHHYLVERLEQIFEPVFIHDSYACRVGKGVHAALVRTRDFIRQGTKNNVVPLYALHLDVKNFFMTIDKRILAGMVEDRLVKAVRKIKGNPP